MRFAVGEGMVLHQEVEQVRGLLLAGSVEGLSEHGLLDVAENPFERVAPGIPEEGRCFSARDQCRPEVRNRRDRLFVVEGGGRRPRACRRLEAILVVFEQQPPCIGVAGDEFQDRAARVFHQSLIPQCSSEQVERFAGLPQATLGKPLPVEGVAADQMFAEPAGGPLAALRAPHGLDAIPDGNDDVEIEVLDLACDPTPTFRSNLCKICIGCSAFQFSLLEYVEHVPVHHRAIPLKELGHLPHGQPDGLLFQAHVQRDLAVRGLIVRGLIDNDLAAGAGLEGVSHSVGSVSLRRHSLVRELISRPTGARRA